MVIVNDEQLELFSTNRPMCRFGHPLDADNTYLARGHRLCKLCLRGHLKAVEKWVKRNGEWA